MAENEQRGPGEPEPGGAAPDAPAADGGLQILPCAVLAQVSADSDADLLTQMADRLVAAGHVKPSFPKAVLEREEKYPTGLPTAVPTAIPHTDAEHVLHAGLAIATPTHPVEFGEMGGSGETTVPAELVVMLVLDSPKAQLEALQALIARLQDEEGVRSVLAASDDDDLRARAARWLAG